MEYARDRTGKDVKPDEVDSGTVLICPVCKKGVHRVQKSKDGRKKPHFAHNKSENTIECENYHPSNYFSTQSQTIEIDKEKLTEKKFTGKKAPEPSFEINIILSKAILKKPSWYIAIVFNKVSIKYQYVIEANSMGEIRVVSTYQKPIPVNIDSSNYKIEISNNANKNVVYVDGLSIKTGNLFTHKGDHGRRLSSHEHLYWGEQYFLVWHKGCRDIMCPPEIVQRVLIPQDNWECVEIQLPNQPRAVIKKWASRYLEKAIQMPSITLSLVTPPIFRKDVLQIKNTDNVVIAVTEPLGNYLKGMLEIKPENYSQRVIDFKGTSPVLIDLGHLTLGKTTLRLNSDAKPLTLTCTYKQEISKLPTAVCLKIQNDLIPAYSLSICDNQFMGLSFPALMDFRILWKSANDLTWQATTITTKKDESQKDFQERAEQAIIELFENKELFIRLDFGNFGQALIQQPVVSSKSEYRLPNEVIQQLRWLASLDQLGAKCTQQASGEGMRMLTKISRHTGDLNKYIQNFNPCVSAMIEPHLRALAKRIKK